MTNFETEAIHDVDFVDGFYKMCGRESFIKEKVKLGKMVVIKKLKEEDWKKYKGLRLESLVKDPAAFGSSYEEEVGLKPKEWKRRVKNALFVVEKGELVGMMVFVFLEKKKIRHIANICGVYVKQEFRGRGFGKKLLEAVLKEIKKNKHIVKINLNVNPKQKAAKRLYEKFGFKVIGTLKKDLFVDGKYYDEVMMEKHIRK